MEGYHLLTWMQYILTPQMFSHDGVHLNQDGEVHMGNRILSWIKENARLPLS